MKNLLLSPPVFGFVIATRAALAFGVGLLVAERIPETRRRQIGLMLVAIGAATTIPAAILAFGSQTDSTRQLAA